MKKKFLSLLLAALMVCGLAVPALAVYYPLSDYPFLQSYLELNSDKSGYCMPIDISSPGTASALSTYNLILSHINDPSRVVIIKFSTKSSSFTSHQVYSFSKSSIKSKVNRLDGVTTYDIVSDSTYFVNFKKHATTDFFYPDIGYLTNGSFTAAALFEGDAVCDKTQPCFVITKNFTLHTAIPVVSGVSKLDFKEIEIPSSSLTVNYIYEGGAQALPPVTQAVEIGGAYDIPTPTITGYTPDLPAVTGTMPDTDTAVTVTYTRNVHDLTINYKYTDGSQASPSITRAMPFGVSYDFPSPEIASFTPSLASVIGDMPDNDVTVDVTYSNAAYTLTVNYLHEDGTQAAQSAVQSLPTNAPYSITSPTLAGYKPDKPVVSGNMPGWNVTVTVTYKVEEESSSSSGGSSSDSSGDAGGGSSSFPFTDPFDRDNFPTVSFEDPFDRSKFPTVSFDDPFDRSKFPSSLFSDPFDRSKFPTVSFGNPFDRSTFPTVEFKDPFDRSLMPSPLFGDFGSFDDYFNSLWGG